MLYSYIGSGTLYLTIDDTRHDFLMPASIKDGRAALLIRTVAEQLQR